MWIIQRILTLLTIVYVCIGSGYAQTDNDCGLERFQCRNGDCIAGELLCDGRADCRDSSDETDTECKKPEILCPQYAFRCNYGGCINGDKVCNGVQDCVDNSDETQPQCTRNTQNTTNNQTGRPARCKKDQFACANGQCIFSTDVCDGIRNCADVSDETSALCQSLPCPPTAFRCSYGACIDGDLRCNRVDNCADGSDEDSRLCDGGWPSPLPPVQPGTTRLPPVRPPTPTPTRPSVTPSTNTCSAPPQPQNGRWKLHRSQCPDRQECNVAEGTELGLGSHLVYSCNSGYKIKGPTDVSCSIEGKWLNIPVCTEIRCKALTIASTTARCTTYEDEWISCKSPVPPRTKAELECQNGYRPETNLLSGQRKHVRCNTNGQWEPEPMRCIPGPLTINIYVNDTKFTFHTALDRNNATFIEVLDDRIIIHTNIKNPNYPDIDVRIPNSSSNIVTNEPWTWS